MLLPGRGGSGCLLPAWQSEGGAVAASGGPSLMHLTAGGHGPQPVPATSRGVASSATGLYAATLSSQELRFSGRGKERKLPYLSFLLSQHRAGFQHQRQQCKQHRGGEQRGCGQAQALTREWGNSLAVQPLPALHLPVTSCQASGSQGKLWTQASCTGEVHQRTVLWDLLSLDYLHGPKVRSHDLGFMHVT